MCCGKNICFERRRFDEHTIPGNCSFEVFCERQDNCSIAKIGSDDRILSPKANRKPWKVFYNRTTKVRVYVYSRQAF